MPEEEEKGPGFSRSHMHLVITDPVHQWQGDNDDIKSYGWLYEVFTVELAQVYTCKYIDSMWRVWHSMAIKYMC